MAKGLKMEDLLKFSKSTELAIRLIEDESSDNTTIKVLHLMESVKAKGSIPATGPNGEQVDLSVSTKEVYVGADNIDGFLKDCEERDGQLYYVGTMHLDVSKPSGRTVNGVFQITKPTRVWLVKTKFSRLGGQSRKDQQQNLSQSISTMFGGGKTLDLGNLATTGTGNTPVIEPVIVPNKAVPVAGK